MYGDFDKLCEDTYEILRIKIYAKIKDRDLTEEVMQETYKIASENKKKLLSHPQPEGWLYTAAVNVYKNKIRKKIKIQNNETELSEEALLRFEAEDGNTADVNRILADLSEEDRELLEMHFYGELSLKDIANTKNINYNTLQSHYRRLIKKIKKKFLEK